MLHKRWISLLVCLLFAALACLPVTTAKAADVVLEVTHSTYGQLAAEITAAAGGNESTYTKLNINISNVYLSGDYQSGDWKTLVGLTTLLPKVNSLEFVYKSGNHTIPPSAMIDPGMWLNSVIFTNAGGQLTGIGDNAFHDCYGLTDTLTIPSSVTDIGIGAFYGCEGLTALSLPASGKLTSIGNKAFEDCTVLSGTLTIPSSVTAIGESAFADCIKLTALSLPASGKLTSIGGSAFYNCSQLSGTLTIPTSVTSIGADAFYKCSKLSGSLTIPSSMTTIEDLMFFGCTGLNGTLTIPSSVTSIGDFAFQGCTGLAALSLPADSRLTTIGGSAFQSCTGLSGTLTIPSSVTSIGTNAFYQCNKLTALSLPASGKLASIGADAFYECSGLGGTLTIPSPVTSIDNEAFYGCTGFNGTVMIPSSVTSIGESAFGHCAGLAALVFKTDSAPTMPDAITDQTINTYYPATADASYKAQGGFPTTNLYTYGDQTARITSLTINGVNGVIDETAKIIKVDLPAGTTLSALKPDIGYIGSAVNPVSGTAQNFSPWKQTCTVTPVSGNDVAYSIYIMGYPVVSGSNAVSGTVGDVGDQAVTAAVSAAGWPEKTTLKASIGGNETITSRKGNGRVTYTFSGSLFDDFSIGRYPITVSADATAYNHEITSTQIGTLTVKPVSPVIKTATANGTSVTVTWDAVSGADGYKVYRFNPGTKAYNEIGSTTTGTSYTQNGLAQGTTYYYAVCSYQTVGGSPIYSDYSITASATTAAAPPKAPGIPSGLKAVSASYNSIALKWNAVSGASGYTVYRALSLGGPYSVIAAKVASAGYTNTNLVAGKTYYYKIKAYILANGAPLYGNETAVVSTKPVPSAPASVKAKRKGTSAALSWGKVSGAAMYEVYRATSSNGKYSCITTVKGTSYVNTRLSVKKTYYYKIRAYALTGMVKIPGTFSPVLKVKP